MQVFSQLLPDCSTLVSNMGVVSGEMLTFNNTILIFLIKANDMKVIQKQFPKYILSKSMKLGSNFEHTEKLHK